MRYQCGLSVYVVTICWFSSDVLGLSINASDQEISVPTDFLNISEISTTQITRSRALTASTDPYNELIVRPTGPVNDSYKTIMGKEFYCDGNIQKKWNVIPSPFNVKIRQTRLNPTRLVAEIVSLNTNALSNSLAASIGLTCYSTPYIGPEQIVEINFLTNEDFKCNRTINNCRTDFDRDSSCDFSKGHCRCPDLQNKMLCLYPDNKSGLNESAVFKAAMVAVACFTTVVICIFILFIYNRARICRELRPRGPLDDVIDGRRDDIFSVSDQLAQERLADKPPTYQEVVRRDKMHRGIPPPAYSDPTRRRNLVNPSTSAEEDDQLNEEHSRIARLAAELQRRSRTALQNTDANVQQLNDNVQQDTGSRDNPAFVSDA